MARDRKAQNRSYYERNRARIREQQRAYRERHREHYNDLSVADTRSVKREVIEAYGGECTCCGNALLVHLTIDHIEGRDGDSKRGVQMYRWLRRRGYPGGFQVLCWNCNAAKHILGTCPCQGAVNG